MPSGVKIGGRKTVVCDVSALGGNGSLGRLAVQEIDSVRRGFPQHAVFTFDIPAVFALFVQLAFKDDALLLLLFADGFAILMPVAMFASCVRIDDRYPTLHD